MFPVKSYRGHTKELWEKPQGESIYNTTVQKKETKAFQADMYTVLVILFSLRCQLPPANNTLCIVYPFKRINKISFL